MRKVLIFALTVLIAIGGLCFAHAAVTDSQDELLIYPTLEIGDRTLLDGRTASMTFFCGDYLSWHTDYTFGGETETAFVYDRKGAPAPSGYARSRMEVWFSGGFGASTSGNFPLSNTDYSALFRAVAVAAPDGGSKTMNVNLSDYVNYYMPDFEVSYEDAARQCHISASLHNLVTGDVWHEDEGNYHEFMEHFRFPVQPNHIVSVTVDKNGAGRINGLHMTPENGPDLHFISEVNADGIWFVPVFRDESGTPLPYESPQGHGIYFLPWKKTGTIRYASGDKDTVVPDLEQAKLLFPLDETLAIEHMQIDPESGEAWMLTLENDRYILTAYDLTAGEVLTRLEVLPHDPEADSNRGHFERDGDYLLITAQERVALVDAASRQLLLTAPDTGQNRKAISFKPADGDLLYDGEHLILIDTMLYQEGTFWTAIFRQGELTYYGEYDCSIMRGNDDWYYSYIGVERDPITLK
ncbi:MAG: hypothetical protein E7451_07560 [Ruminococcaceae bacterium]|nr:hypothetical protein [Oscillospiraceae bacterium]